MLKKKNQRSLLYVATKEFPHPQSSWLHYPVTIDSYLKLLHDACLNFPHRVFALCLSLCTVFMCLFMCHLLMLQPFSALKPNARKYDVNGRNICDML